MGVDDLREVKQADPADLQVGQADLGGTKPGRMGPGWGQAGWTSWRHTSVATSNPITTTSCTVPELVPCVQRAGATLVMA